MSHPSRLLGVSLALLLGLAAGAHAAEVLVQDEKSSPESLTVAPGGTVYVGSASSPYVYRIKPGGSAERFIDVSADGPGTFFFGMLADAASNTLWTCELTPVGDTRPVQRKSALRGFDLTTGAPKLRWDLPGPTSTCNDFSYGPDKALYISDTGNGRIYKLAPGAASADLFLESRVLNGIDGITFLNGVLYANNVSFNNLYRIPVDATGKPGQPADIWMDQPVKGPDGMRAVGNRILLAENGAGKIDTLTIDGDRAHVTVLTEGLKTPTAVEPAGDVIWIAERGAGKARTIPMPK